MSERSSTLILAEAAYARNDLEQAKGLCLRAIEANPNEVSAFVLLGAALARLRDSNGSIASLSSALRIDPDHLEAHIALSTMLASVKQFDTAIAHAQRAQELQPDDPDVEANLARILLLAGFAVSAVEIFERAVEARPGDVGLRQGLARALKEAHREFDAVTQWEEVVRLAPRSLPGWLSLGQLRMAHGDLKKAVECGRKAVTLAPNHAPAHLMLALALAESDRGNEAERHLRKAVTLDPNQAIAHAALGYWFQERGRFDEARESLERAIALNSAHGFAYYNLYRAKKATEADEKALVEMADLAKRPDFPVRDRGYLHYALGKAFEDLHRYEDAMRHYDAGNACAYEQWLAHRPWDREEYASGFDQTIRRFDRARFDKLSEHGLASETPIVIVGMIRSGTSLLEQMLSSHPDVVGAGELPFWHLHEPEAYGVDGMPDVDRLRSLGEEYLAELKRIAPGAKRVTDKLPHNYAMLGLIHAALPNARIIHLRRNPVDNCLSVYTTAYQRPPAFAHRKENIVFAYREYRRIMAHWREVFPTDRLIEIDYESLVEDKDATLRQIVAFCGLPWDDRCLRHEQNDRSVRTPSLWQVRQPIYSTSIARWERFGPWISEFLELPAE